jgi:hypothetical protein
MKHAQYNPQVLTLYNEAWWRRARRAHARTHARTHTSSPLTLSPPLSQVDDWKPELVQIEAEAKADASVLLFVIDSQTRAISSIAETSEYICSGRCVVLVIKEVQPGTVIAGAEASIGECKDLNRARVYLADIAKRHGVPIFTDIAKSVDHICSAVSSGKEV